MMSDAGRGAAFRVIVIFNIISCILLLFGQTAAIWAYDFTVSTGMQESVEEVTPFGVQMNRAFGVGDTFVYIPFIVLGTIGLFMRRRWSLIMNAAAMGISVYWTLTMAFVLIFGSNVPGYTLQPGIEYVIFLGAFMLFGLWGIWYLSTRGERLLQ
jgi:hypothetical protein